MLGFLGKGTYAPVMSSLETSNTTHQVPYPLCSAHCALPTTILFFHSCFVDGRTPYVPAASDEGVYLYGTGGMGDHEHIWYY